MKKSYTIIAVVCIVVVLLIAWAVSQKSADSDKTGTVVPTLEKISEKDNVRGNPAANVVVIEYGDFQCPACGAYHPLLQQVEKDMGDKVAFVFRHFPLSSIHPNAEIGSRATEAAGEQGKFWEMHDMLYEKQAEWSTSADARTILIGYAQSLGLDTGKFKEALNSKKVKDKVNADRNSGTGAKVDATPTFFVNGVKIKNPQSVAEFEKILQTKIDDDDAAGATNQPTTNANGNVNAGANTNISTNTNQ